MISHPFEIKPSVRTTGQMYSWSPGGTLLARAWRKSTHPPSPQIKGHHRAGRQDLWATQADRERRKYHPNSGGRSNAYLDTRRHWALRWPSFGGSVSFDAGGHELYGLGPSAQPGERHG
jgi:hypothetical protein